MYWVRTLGCVFLLIGLMISGCGKESHAPKRLVLAEIDSDGDNTVEKTVRYIYDNSSEDGSEEDTVITIERGTSHGCPDDLSESFFFSFEAYTEVCMDDIEDDVTNSNDWTMPVHVEDPFGQSFPYHYIYTSNESYIAEYDDLTFDSVSSDDQLSFLRFANISGYGNVPQKAKFIYRHDNDGYVIAFEHIKYYEDDSVQTLRVDFTWE